MRMIAQHPVVTAQAGTQYAAANRLERGRLRLLDSRLRGNDGKGGARAASKDGGSAGFTQ